MPDLATSSFQQGKTVTLRALKLLTAFGIQCGNKLFY